MQQKTSSRNLTPLYCLHQALYFFAMAGTSAFATTYLLTRGFDAAQIGILLAATNVLSCTLQPAIGSYVDRTSVSVLQKIVPAFLITAVAALSAAELLSVPLLITGFLYITGSLSFSITIPLCNSLCAHYSRNGWQINYGAGSGIGSLSFSFASLGFGYIIAGLGASAMIWIAIAVIALQLGLMRCYPQIDAVPPAQRTAGQSSLSMIGFICRYRLFMITMLGVVLLAGCHAMAENFLIQIFGRIGGGSKHVGITLFLACISDAPFMLYFERIQKRISIVLLMRLAGLFYVAKALLLIWAPSILSVYLIGLLQTCTYAFLYPSLYYLVLARIAPEDMAKGQMLANAMFVLGMALGNSLGGIVIEAAGLNAMLTLAACIAALGTLLINLAITRRDVCQ